MGSDGQHIYRTDQPHILVGLTCWCRPYPDSDYLSIIIHNEEGPDLHGCEDHGAFTTIPDEACPICERPAVLWPPVDDASDTLVSIEAFLEEKRYV